MSRSSSELDLLAEDAKAPVVQIAPPNVARVSELRRARTLDFEGRGWATVRDDGLDRVDELGDPACLDGDVLLQRGQAMSADRVGVPFELEFVNAITRWSTTPWIEPGISSRRMTEHRLAEVVASLSLATEAAAGVAPETASRAAIVAEHLAESMGASVEARRDVFYAALLRYIGCTGFAHETAAYGAGDDIGLLRALTPMDAASPASVASHVVRGVAKGRGLLTRAKSVARILGAPTMPLRLATAHCEQAVRLAEQLGAGAGVTEVLGQIYERFDGKGGPHRLAREQLAPTTRILHAAYVYVLHASFEGPGAALDVVRARSGGEIDPSIATRLETCQRALLEIVRAPSVWEMLLEREPRPLLRIGEGDLERVAKAFAKFIDLKSPFTTGHSVGVAQLTASALKRAGASEDEQSRGRIAGLLHDLGRVGIPNGIWDKPTKLGPVERDRVEEHARIGGRVLERSRAFRDHALIVESHHERLDGSGYHRRVRGDAIERIARVVAAADVFRALTEERAYRSAQTADAASETLRAEVSAGRLCGKAALWVLDSAGFAASARRVELPHGLSEREVEVLRLLARGLTNKEIGRRLFISPRTVGHHVAHIFDKTGVRTRAAAALFAATHDLANP